MFYIIPAAILVLITIFVVLGYLTYANQLSVFFWVVTLLITTYYLVKEENVLSKIDLWKKKEKIKAFFKPANVKRLFFLIFVLALIKSAFREYYLFGGDDTRLFYLFPQEYLENVGLRTIPITISGFVNFLPNLTLLPFLYFLSFLKTLIPGLNLQAILYTANIFTALFFFYKFLSLFLSGSRYFYLKLLASLMYVFSIFNIYTLFNSKLIAIYILSLLPMTLYWFIKAVRENKLYFIFAVALVWSLFGLVSYASLWFLASLVTVVPIIIYATWENKTRLFAYSGILAVLLFLLNLHWIIYLPHTSLMQSMGGLTENSLVSEGFLEDNASGIISTAEKNEVFYPLFNLFHFKIQKDFNWPYLLIFERWHLKILPFNFIFFASVVAGSIFIKKKSRYKKIYFVSVLSFLIAIYFFTVNFGNSKLGNPGITSFVWMNNYIPGFTIFRNMYDKFANAYAFNYALIFAVSLAVVFERFRSAKLKIYITVIAFFVVLLNAKPYLFNEFENLPVWTTSNIYNKTIKINSDYFEMMNFIKEQPYYGRYLSLPLNAGNLALIQDENIENYYYQGVSPLTIFSGKDDLSGILSFGSYSGEIRISLLEQDHKKTAGILQKLNANYIIVNHSIPEEIAFSYMYSGGYFEAQDEDFYDLILGNKVKDFGKKYSLYKVNENYQSNKFYLTKDLQSFPQNAKVDFTKEADFLYKIKISSLEGEEYLVFLEPYFSGWELYTNSGELVNTKEQEKVFRYANAWKLDEVELRKNHSSEIVVNEDGSIDLEMELYFTPRDHYQSSFLISASVYLLSFAYIIFRTIKVKKNEKQ